MLPPSSPSAPDVSASAPHRARSHSWFESWIERGHPLALLTAFLVSVPLFMAAIALPGVACCWVVHRWVVRVTDMPFLFLSAHFGLFIGSYMSLACLGFEDREWRRLARLKVRRSLDALPGHRVALAGRVVEGTSVSPEAAARRGHTDERATWVTFPLIVEDADEVRIRIEDAQGSRTAPREETQERAHDEARSARSIEGEPGRANELGVDVREDTAKQRHASDWVDLQPLFALGDPVFLVGQLERIWQAGGYRGGTEAFRLVQEGDTSGQESLFTVHRGTQESLPRDRHATTPGWWRFSLGWLALGVVSVVVAQVLAQF
ncbi:hypothetical protein [Chondromyces crocatus]|uniref:Uncharacterized protein n=1 Tax=Chondromyces crocatus TaxID=52 RepID=A0A0K1E9Z5_CHOCO|nr:hypothetical protein [Chondromyces crocatus]AKT37685.1 uncharacterized protein CMC5_018270 [Chondromyces crocatus]